MPATGLATARPATWSATVRHDDELHRTERVELRHLGIA
jgi:hypothetical protein